MYFCYNLQPSSVTLLRSVIRLCELHQGLSTSSLKERRGWRQVVESAESEEAGSAGRAADGDGDGRASQVVEISHLTPTIHSLAVYDTVKYRTSYGSKPTAWDQLLTFSMLVSI